MRYEGVDYDFEVALIPEWKWEGDTRLDGQIWGSYHVDLPHQCDEWQVAGGSHWNEGQQKHIPYTKAETIAQLEMFIDRAKQALMELKELPDVVLGSLVEVDKGE